MNKIDLVAAAQSAPAKRGLLEHREAVRILRAKGYAWRDIAKFLADNGVITDHTTLYRTFKDIPAMTRTITIPSATAYAAALPSLKLSDKQRAMLLAHFNAHNRSITYTQLANAAGEADYGYANRWYGEIGRKLGEALDFEFNEYEHGAEVKTFYSSAIGQQNHYTTGEFQLVMHHELAKAIEMLGWAEMAAD
jgi:hypothetical protein